MRREHLGIAIGTGLTSLALAVGGVLVLGVCPPPASRFPDARTVDPGATALADAGATWSCDDVMALVDQALSPRALTLTILNSDRTFGPDVRACLAARGAPEEIFRIAALTDADRWLYRDLLLRSAVEGPVDRSR